jgi:hypothetical protein
VKTEREKDERTFAEDDQNAPRGPSVVERLWLVAAAAFLTAAAFLLLRSHTDAAFVTAALGVCAWFLNVRDRLKREHNLRKRGRRNWEQRSDDAE